MEQILSAFGVDGRLIVIQVFNFALLAGLLWYFLYTPVLKILHTRKEKIEQGVRDAIEAQRTREEADTEKAAILGDTHKEAEEITLRAKSHAEEKAAEILQASEARAASIVRDAEEQGRISKERALEESEAEIAKLAVLAAEKILREKA